MKKKKIVIILSIITLVLIMVLITLIVFFGQTEKEDKIPKTTDDTTQNETVKTTAYKAGNYVRVDNPTNYQKTIFDALKDLLATDDYTDQALAETIVKNFIVEFYNLSNVTSKDVRGTQYVADELKDRFKNYASDIYNYYQYYTNIKDLEVKNIEISSTKAITYNYADELKQIANKSGLKGYEVTVKWSYKDDTNYTTKVTIVKWNDNYSIIKVTN